MTKQHITIENVNNDVTSNEEDQPIIKMISDEEEEEKPIENNIVSFDDTKPKPKPKAKKIIKDEENEINIMIKPKKPKKEKVLIDDINIEEINQKRAKQQAEKVVCEKCYKAVSEKTYKYSHGSNCKVIKIDYKNIENKLDSLVNKIDNNIVVSKDELKPVIIKDDKKEAAKAKREAKINNFIKQII